MATFTNMATLTYNGGTAVSNTVTGELLDTLTVTKTAIMDDYAAGDDVTYVVTIRNTGTAAVNDVTVTDNLGAYAVGGQTYIPLTYVADSLHYYVGGLPQTAPTPTTGTNPALSIAGLTVPAGGNIMLIYEAEANQYAPLAADSTIDNTVTVTGAGITTPITATAQITTEARAALTISKAMSPTTVTENGQLTYTFIIQNTGNTAADTGVVLNDTFTPALDNIAVTLNGTALTPTTDYTYTEATGVFATVAGVITVPAATYTQNADGTWTTTPGTATVTVTGTV